MQYVFLRSGVTYECTQVTPSLALFWTTDDAAFAPAASEGSCKPSGNVRSTMYRGMMATSKCCKAPTRDDHNRDLHPARAGTQPAITSAPPACAASQCARPTTPPAG